VGGDRSSQHPRRASERLPALIAQGEVRSLPVAPPESLHDDPLCSAPLAPHGPAPHLRHTAEALVRTTYRGHQLGTYFPQAVSFLLLRTCAVELNSRIVYRDFSAAVERISTPYLVCAPGLRSLENAQEAENGSLVLCRSTASEESPLGLLGRLDR
jgi:hypothetical protein